MEKFKFLLSALVGTTMTSAMLIFLSLLCCKSFLFFLSIRITQHHGTSLSLAVWQATCSLMWNSRHRCADFTAVSISKPRPRTGPQRIGSLPWMSKLVLLAASLVEANHVAQSYALMPQKRMKQPQVPRFAITKQPDPLESLYEITVRAEESSRRSPPTIQISLITKQNV